MSTSLQKQLLRLVSLTALVALLTLTVAGSLSRGSWLGGAIGVVVMCICYSKIGAAVSLNLSGGPRNDNSVSGGPVSAASAFSWRSVAAVGLMVVVIVGLFLNTQGRERFAERVRYGLLHSKDDMRWVLYQDTLSMIADNPLFGVGLGAWDDIYPQYVNRLLAGVDPEFLHNDPLQLLAEAGLFGVLPVVLLCIVVSKLTFRALRGLPRRDGLLLSGLFAGFTSLTVASFLDFPFHIPAIMLEAALALGLMLRFSSRARHN